MYKNLAHKFIKKHDKGSWTPLDRLECMAIEMFANWLDEAYEAKTAAQIPERANSQSGHAADDSRDSRTMQSIVRNVSV